jgi:hypothetical protein
VQAQELQAKEIMAVMEHHTIIQQPVVLVEAVVLLQPELLAVQAVQVVPVEMEQLRHFLEVQ